MNLRAGLLPAALFAALLGAAPPALRAQDAEAPPAVAAEAPPGLPWKSAEAAGGRLEVLPGGIAVLHLSGTPAQMGKQHGTLLREPVRWLVQRYLPKVLRGRREEALVRARALEKQIPARHREEMAALAEAAGLERDDILLASVVVELLGLNQCSGFVAWGGLVEGGGTVVGRTLEWPDHGMLGQYGLVVAARPEGRRPFLSISFPGMVGVVTGMNGDGVFASELVVLKPVDGEQALRGVPYPILQRRLLEECGSLEAAVALVRATPRTVAQNLLLAGPGGGAALECAADRFVERTAVREGLVVVTNHWEENLTAPSADPRFRRMCAALEPSPGKERLDEAAMEKTMRATGMVVGFMNLHGGLFFPDTLRVRVAIGKPPAVRGELHELDGAALLGVPAPAARPEAGGGGATPREKGADAEAAPEGGSR